MSKIRTSLGLTKALLTLAGGLTIGGLSSNAQEVDVIILSGQSNAQGVLYTDVSKLPAALQGEQSNVYFADRNNRTWRKLNPPTSGDYDFSIGALRGFGPEITFCERVYNETGRPVYLFKQAHPGASLDYNFLTPEGGDNLEFMKQFGQEALQTLQDQYGVTGRITGFLWMQGESDINPQMAPRYRDNLNFLISEIRNTFNNQEMPVIIGRTSHYDPGPPSAAAVQVRDAQSGWADADPNGYWIDTDSFTRHAGDEVHLDEQGLMDLGYAFADLYLDHYEGGNSGNNSNPITGIKKIINRRSGKALETSFQQRTNDWAFVDTYSYWGGENQRWEIIQLDDGHYRIMNVSNGGALEVGYDGRFDEGTTVDAYIYHGGGNQRWYIDDQGDGSYNIKSKGSGYFLGTNKFGWLDGVEQRAWEAADRQRWEISNP